MAIASSTPTADRLTWIARRESVVSRGFSLLLCRTLAGSFPSSSLIKVVDYLGSGTSSDVYKVELSDRQAEAHESKSEHKERAQEAACKVFLADHVRAYQNERAVYQELNEINSPHVLRYLGDCEVQPSGLPAMLLSPVCFRPQLCSDHVEPTQLVTGAHLSQLVEATLTVHTHLGMVIRDISPANILIDPTGNLRLADFGCACHPHNIMCVWEGTYHYAPSDVLLELPDISFDAFYKPWRVCSVYS